MPTQLSHNVQLNIWFFFIFQGGAIFFLLPIVQYYWEWVSPWPAISQGSIDIKLDFATVGGFWSAGQADWKPYWNMSRLELFEDFGFLSYIISISLECVLLLLCIGGYSLLPILLWWWVIYVHKLWITSVWKEWLKQTLCVQQQFQVQIETKNDVLW